VVASDSANIPYRTRFSAAGHEAYSDASEVKGGAGAGFGPHELLEASVACCINIWLRMYADKNGIPLSGVRVDVCLNRETPGETRTMPPIGPFSPVGRKETCTVPASYRHRHDWGARTKRMRLSRATTLGEACCADTTKRR
jgi:hypothetical protein